MTTVRIVTADDHTIFREGLRRLLEAEPGFSVVGEAATGRHALTLVGELRPDLLLLDLQMPDVSGLDVLRALAAANNPVRVVLLTAGAEKPVLIEALRLGARGLILKDSATALLFKCIRSVMANEYWFGHDRLPDLVEAVRQLSAVQVPPPAQRLTRRELDIISAIVSGATNRDVSAQFGLSEQTVKNHLSRIFDKLGVSNRLELALYVIHHKLLDGSKR